MEGAEQPSIRPLRLEEVEVRIDYFHDASDEYLAHLGVDRSLLPSKKAWREYYEKDFARSLAERDTYNLAWELDGRSLSQSTSWYCFRVASFMSSKLVEICSEN